MKESDVLFAMVILLIVGLVGQTLLDIEGERAQNAQIDELYSKINSFPHLQQPKPSGDITLYSPDNITFRNGMDFSPKSTWYGMNQGDGFDFVMDIDYGYKENGTYRVCIDMGNFVILSDHAIQLDNPFAKITEVRPKIEDIRYKSADRCYISSYNLGIDRLYGRGFLDMGTVSNVTVTFYVTDEMVGG